MAPPNSAPTLDIFNLTTTTSFDIFIANKATAYSK
jgi:hypothetical protein